MIRIGVIADTHGCLHPQVAHCFAGVERIIHAGDIGGLSVLSELERIAPVIAVRGNYDLEPELQDRLLPDPSPLELFSVSALLTHRLLSVDWESHRELLAELILSRLPTLDLFIFGHTHFPVLEKIKGLCFVNPGYCGPDRLEGDPTVAVLEIEGREISGRIIRLSDAEDG